MVFFVLVLFLLRIELMVEKERLISNDEMIMRVLSFVCSLLFGVGFNNLFGWL